MALPWFGACVLPVLAASVGRPTYLPRPRLPEGLDDGPGKSEAVSHELEGPVEVLSHATFHPVEHAVICFSFAFNSEAADRVFTRYVSCMYMECSPHRRAVGRPRSQALDVHRRSHCDTSMWVSCRWRQTLQITTMPRPMIRLASRRPQAAPPSHRFGLAVG